MYLYESVPGGVGLAARLWERHAELVTGAAELITACSCDAGCPACTGPRLEPDADAKALALRLLAELQPASSPVGDPPAGAPEPSREGIEAAPAALSASG